MGDEQKRELGCTWQDGAQREAEDRRPVGAAWLARPCLPAPRGPALGSPPSLCGRIRGRELSAGAAPQSYHCCSGDAVPVGAGPLGVHPVPRMGLPPQASWSS